MRGGAREAAINGGIFCFASSLQCSHVDGSDKSSWFTTSTNLNISLVKRVGRRQPISSYPQGAVLVVSKDIAKRTLEFLTRTSNEAAVSVLLAGLESSDPTLQEASLTALLCRRHGTGQTELIQRWDTLSERWRWIIAQHPRQVAPAVRNAILSADEHLCTNGCDALLRIREYELIATLVTTVRDAAEPQASLTAKTLVELAQRLNEELAQPPEARHRRDLAGVRRQVVLNLEQGVEAYEQHRRREIVEAFLLLCQPDNRLLNTILVQPRHTAYLIVMELLRSSERTGIIQLILNFLNEPRAPSAILQVIGHRTDMTFIQHLLHAVGAKPTREVRANLHRLESIRWLAGDLAFVTELTELEQQAALQVTLDAGVTRPTVFRFIQHVLAHGSDESRRLAAHALAEFGGAKANELALQLLNDPNPHVQAEALLQLRKRSVPGAMGHLIRALSSPHEVVREAARSCLVEFRFERYLNAFDTMEDAARRSTGKLVKEVDPDAPARLAAELQSRLRARRMRALEIVQAMDLIEQLEPLVISLTDDEDHFVRAAAARALAQTDSVSAIEALRRCLSDRSIMVRDTARDSLAQQQRRTGLKMPVVATPNDPSGDTPSNETVVGR